VSRVAPAIVVALVALSIGLHAQSALRQAPDTPASATAPTSDVPARDRVSVPEPTPQALAYYRSGNVLWVANTIWALFVPAVLLWTGLSARMRDWARAVGRRWFFVVAIYWAIFTILTTAVDLPREYYENFIR
jgi:STE24 endopeptidase